MGTLFCEHQMAAMVEAFNDVVVKKHFYVNFQRSEFVWFWSVSRESVNKLIYQKKNGVQCNASKQSPTSCVRTLYIP